VELIIIFRACGTRGRVRHLEGPKKPDGLNFGIHVFVYVYKVHICMHMLGGKILEYFFGVFCRHIASAPSTSGTHTVDAR